MRELSGDQGQGDGREGPRGRAVVGAPSRGCEEGNPARRHSAGEVEAGYILRSCRKIIKNKQTQKNLARVSGELWPRSLCESHQ